MNSCIHVIKLRIRTMGGWGRVGVGIYHDNFVDMFHVWTPIFSVLVYESKCFAFLVCVYYPHTCRMKSKPMHSEYQFLYRLQQLWHL